MKLYLTLLCVLSLSLYQSALANEHKRELISRQINSGSEVYIVQSAKSLESDFVFSIVYNKKYSELFTKQFDSSYGLMHSPKISISERPTLCAIIKKYKKLFEHKESNEDIEDDEENVDIFIFSNIDGEFIGMCTTFYKESREHLFDIDQYRAFEKEVMHNQSLKLIPQHRLPDTASLMLYHLEVTNDILEHKQ